MKKISIVFDGGHFSKGVIEFVRHLNDVTPISVTACFLKQEHFVNSSSFANIAEYAYENEEPLVDAAIQRFTDACEKYDLNFKVHDYDPNYGIASLRKLSRFSDVMVVSSELFFQNVNHVQPNEFLKDLLHVSECPVFAVPEKFTFPTTIILAYDGSESSLFAIKEFANLFPELCERKTMLVYGYGENEHIPELNTIKDLASCHFSNFGIYRLHIDQQHHFNTWLQDISSPLVVSGSFGRSHLYEFIRRSFVSDTIHDHKAIVFVAHR